jgi:hypothetical protein
MGRTLLAEQIEKAGIQRHRKFYATRHTTITELVKAGHKLKEIADYCGTSVTMIEDNYCARQQLKPGNREVFEKLVENVNDIMHAGQVSSPPPRFRALPIVTVLRRLFLHAWQF